MADPIPVSSATSSAVGDLRRSIAQLESGAGRRAAASRFNAASTSVYSPAIVPFGVTAIDRILPAGGLVIGAMHEVSGTGPDTEHAAGATLFVAGIAARTMAALRRWGIWIARDPPYLPALIACGLDPDRLLFAGPRSRSGVLQAMEDALRSGSMAVVVGEPGAELTHVASRRLQLAAEMSGAVGLVLRRSRVFDDPRLEQPSASMTRWRVGAAPSGPAYPGRPSLRGLGPARWRLDLVKNRGGDIGSWLVETCDAQGRLRLAADAADRSAAAKRRGADLDVASIRRAAA